MKRLSFFKKFTAALLTPALIVTSSSVILAADSDTSISEMPTASAISSFSDTDAPYVEGEILITYQDDVCETEVRDAVEALDGEIVDEVADLDEETVALVSISDDMTVSEAVESYQSDPAIAYAEPNYIMEIYDDEETEDSESTENQWYLDYVCAQEAWDSLSGVSGETVRVAVIDTGADLTHEDLANVINTELSVEIVRTMQRPSVYSYSTIQLRGDGYLNGSDTQNSSSTHGTHVTGILAAESGNGVGIQGTASGGTTSVGNHILDLVVIDSFSSQDSSGEDVTSVSEILYAMQYAEDVGCRVINLSMGTTGESSTLEAMCTQLYEDGVVVVCAAGNSGSTDAFYPSDYDTTISVINITSAGKRSSGSSYGDAKDLSAPGYRIYSTLNGGGYGYLSGTSMATPIVTSAAAMLLYADSDLTPAEIRTILCGTATDLLDEGKDEETGYGAVNIQAALESILPAQEESDDTDTGASGETGDSDAESSDEVSGDELTAGSTDSLAVRRGNTYYFLYSLDSDEADLTLSYGTSSDDVYIGDWDGDGVDTLCVRRGNTYYFKNSLEGGDADEVIVYGKSSDTVLAGDWDGDGVDTLCVRRGNTYYIINSLKSGDADEVITYGRSSDEVYAGDWDGDGVDTLCVRRGNTYYLKNSLETGDADQEVTFGKTGDEVLIGDWDGDGADTLCVRRENLYCFLNSFESAEADPELHYGKSDDKVYAGKWQ